MTQPDDAGDLTARLAAGNTALVANPRVLNGLVTAGATPQQAQATNQYLLALQAQIQGTVTPVGHTTPLSAQSKTAAQAIGASDSTQVKQGGWFSSVGSFFHHLTHNPVTNNPVTHFTTEPVLNALNAVGNSALTGLGNVTQGFKKDFTDPGSLLKNPFANGNAGSASATEAAKAAGYDPSNPLSMIAYGASGQAKSDLSDLYAANGTALVDQAIQLNQDPEKVRQQLLFGPNLTEEQRAANIKLLDPSTPEGKRFANLTLQVAARSDTPGSIITQGIDPIKHSTTKRLTGASIDIAASFLLDPTLVASKGVTLYKASQIGLDSIGDITKVRNVLTPVKDGGSAGRYATQVRNGMQSFVDNMNTVRAGQAEGATIEDRAAAAAATARIHAATPGLEGLMDDFSGERRIIGNDSAGKPIIGKGAPITRLDEAADYLASKDGIIRYMAGQTGAEIGLMPGQLSKIGAKALRANLAGSRVGKGATKALNAIDLTKPSVLDHLLAKPGDQVDVATGRVVADAEGDAAAASGTPSTPQLASALRAAAVDQGEERYNQLRGSLKGLGPVATYRRWQLAVQRTKTFLPKTTTFNVNEQSATRDIINYSKTYLTDSDAHLMGSVYAVADSATRKALLSGLALQVAHAAGLGTTEGGRAELAVLAREFTTHQYSVTADRFVDDFTGMERDAAILPSDVNETLTLPSFKTLQQNAAKIGIWQNTVGRFAQNEIVDNLMKIVKVGWQLRPAGVLRNAGEDLFGAFLRGELPHVLLAKRVAQEAGVLGKSRLGNALGNPILNVTRMYAQHRIAADANRLGYIARLKPDELSDLSDNFKRLLGELVDPNGDRDLKEIHEAGMVPKRLSFNAKRTGFEDQSAQGSIGAIRYSRYLGHVYGGNKDLVDTILGHLAPRTEEAATKAQAVVKPLDERVRDAYYGLVKPTADNPEPMVSLVRLRKALPDVPRDDLDSALKKIAREEGDLIPESNQKMLTQEQRDAAIQHGGQEKHLATMRHRPPTEPGEGDLATAAPAVRAPKTPEDIIAALRADPRLKDMIRATHYQDNAGNWLKAVTDDEKDQAHSQLAHAITTEVKYLLTGQNGELNTKLADYLTEYGHAPSADWIEHNLTDEDRPTSVLAPVFQAVPPKSGVKGWIEAAADLSGRGYEAMVAQPIARISTMPIFLNNYADMRVFLEPREADLVAGGVTEKAADATMREAAMQMAMTRTLKYIDDPTLRTAMDITGRNFFAFSRATTAFVRRWSTQLIEDPSRLRKAQLVHQAAVRTGIIYKDPNGGENFVYPGSGWAIKHVLDLGNLFGLNLSQTAGVVPNLTSQVGFLNPGLTNPAQLSLTPLANMPLREAKKVFPTHATALEKIDRFFNGSAGAGASLKADLTPGFYRQFGQALDTSKDSLTADSVRGMAMSLGAAKLLPGTILDANGNPVPTNPAELQAFQDKMTATAQNHMMVRAIFGLFAPASPGTPTEENDASQSDYLYGIQGIHGLDAEWKQMLNDADGDYAAALQVWTELHPDKLMFTVPPTQVGTKSAVVQATEASNQWITQNKDFLKKYNTVGAYFLPQADQGGDFDTDAYRAEMTLGLRQHKDLNDFIADVSTATATQQFYNAIAVRDQALADHADDPDMVKTIKANFSSWQDTFNKFNPLFAQTQQDFSAAQNTAAGQLGSLQDLVKDPDVPSDVPKAEIQQMIDAYTTYHQVTDSIVGQTDAAVAQRALVGGNYDAWFQKFLKAHPDLGGLYAGVFRTLDNKILDPVGSS